MSHRFAVLVVLAVSALIVGAAPASASKNLYLASGDDGTNAKLQAFSLSADGTPAPLQTYLGESSGYFNAISMTPDGRFLFAMDYNSSEIRSFSVDADGKLTDAPGSPLIPPGNTGPYGSAVTPDGKFLIAGLYNTRSVQAFAIGADGSLSAAAGGPVELGPSAYPYGVAVSTDSRTLYVPDYANDNMHFFRIATDGKLTEPAGSPVATGNQSYHAAVSPDGKYLFAPNGGSDDVSVYSLDGEGIPTELAASPFPVMTDTYGGFSVSPDGRTLYSSGSNDGIESATIGPDGALAAGPSIMVGAYNAPLALNPAGTRLYNGVDENSVDNRLVTYSVGAGGALTPFGTPLTLDEFISPDSDSLVVSPAQPPVAALTTQSGSKAQVSFDASGSTDPDGPIASYAWDFGDGQTAETTTPTTTHSYATDGDYTATVTLTDVDNCSTEMIFTGRTAYCNGSDVAKAAATTVADSRVTGAKVTAKKIQKQKGLLIKVKAGAAEAVSLRASGGVKFKGVKKKVALKTLKARSGAGKYRMLKLRPKSKKKGRVATRRKGKATITVKLTDELGNSLTKKVKVKTVPARKKR
ncbi:MAG: beta-propeller fold lactonase family protein [Solirubrobacterales bacterium]